MEVRVTGAFEQDEREWLEADGLGGFASGTVSGVRTRRYHALLLTATTPPTGRIVLVNGFDAWIESGAGRVALSTQRYEPDTRHPDGAARITVFDREPWPSWTFTLPDGTKVRQEIFVPHGRAAAVLAWRVMERPAGPTVSTEPLRLLVRPFLSGRDYHSTHHENAACRTDAQVGAGLVTWRPYEGAPGVISRANARYEHQPDWYRRFLYSAERERGLDDREDLFAPGWLSWDLSAAEAVWMLEPLDGVPSPQAGITETVAALRDKERARRGSFATPLHRAADAYLVRRDGGRTILAGYPWFTDWGRDTFIAMRGLCLATGRFAEARAILLEWSGLVSEGMLPNRFPDAGAEPEFNAVDASLWFAAAVGDFRLAVDGGEAALTPGERSRLTEAVRRIVDGYARGTRYGIRMDDDGLLACGVPGVQLTWMDSKIGDWVVTPRVGKPVEVQSLWLNALRLASEADPQWEAAHHRALESFSARFWSDERGHLYDVVDVNHERGRVDATFRPNQVLAVGGLPAMLLDSARARRVIDQIEARLLTPVGLRSLAATEPGYVAYYRGGPAQRDASYHQGTVWPWLMGAFVEGWVRVRGNTTEARAAAYDRFVRPLRLHLDEAGLGHVSEIADAEPPHTPAGCPFQAWSVGELLRLEQLLAAPTCGAHPR
jgi:predicted glycogen debranching enzyme